MKKLSMIILCSIIAFSPLLTLGNFTFAEDTPQGGGGAWVHPQTHEEVVAAFKAYCKSRNFKFVHSSRLEQAIVAFDYDQFVKTCTILNIDPEGLNAEIWYSYTKAPKKLKWFFNQTAMGKFNSIYASILEQYNMQFDNVEDKVVYSGVWLEDDDGLGTYCYIIPTNATYYQWSQSNFANATKGSIYKPEEYGNYLYNTGLPQGATMGYVSYFNDVRYEYYLKNTTNKYGEEPGIYCRSTNSFPAGNYIYQIRSIAISDGYITLIKNSSGYYIGAYRKVTYNQGDAPVYQVETIVRIEPDNPVANQVRADQGEAVQPVTNQSLTIITDVDTINNYITNDSHDTYNYSDDEEPDEQPKQKPVPPDSITPNPTNPSLPTGIPDVDFQMPNLNIDWNLDLDINNLPFPFSIPHDIIRFLTILDSEPEAPKYEIHTEIFDNPIDLEIDLSVFDNGMVIIRNIILVGYVIFLIVSTRALFHIY